MAGILSKDIKFSVAEYTGTTVGSYTEVDNLQEIPSLGGTPDKIEVTVLKDEAKHYINGLKDYGDLAFKFLYDNSGTTSNYRVLKDLEGEKVSVKIELPDAVTASTGTGTTFIFDAYLTTSLDGVGTNSALTFTCNAALQSDIDVTDPT